MATITIVNKAALIKLDSLARGQRKVVTKHMLALAGNGNTVDTDALVKVTAPEIERNGTVQTGAYVTSYYLSEQRKNAIIEGGYMQGTRGNNGAIRNVLTEARNAPKK